VLNCVQKSKTSANHSRIIEYYDHNLTPEIEYSTPGAYEDCDDILQQKPDFVHNDYYRQDLENCFGKSYIKSMNLLAMSNI
jgi:hypothetical protein